MTQRRVCVQTQHGVCIQMGIHWIMNNDTAQSLCTDTARSVHTNGYTLDHEY